MAWVHPWTLTAALRIAKARDVDFERVIGEWADRPREEEEWGAGGYRTRICPTGSSD